MRALLFTVIGFTSGSVVVYLMTDRDSAGIGSLRQTIHSMQARLDAQDAELRNLRRAAHTGAVFTAAFGKAPADHVIAGNRSANSSAPADDESRAPHATDGTRTLKDLETVSEGDPLPFVDKLTEFLSGNPDAQEIAIASRGIFDMARDRDQLPDHALQAIYDGHDDPDLKRVIAQVLSRRGNNLPLESQIAEARAQLKSDQPEDRQAALGALGKTRSVKAVDAITPYLQDSNTNVKLEALQALGATGNQSHVGLVQGLVNDPDPAVSSLATEVQLQLANLSSNARTTISRSDIEATLPPILNP